jgi:hypothetical protein
MQINTIYYRRYMLLLYVLSLSLRLSQPTLYHLTTPLYYRTLNFRPYGSLALLSLLIASLLAAMKALGDPTNRGLDKWFLAPNFLHF